MRINPLPSLVALLGSAAASLGSISVNQGEMLLTLSPGEQLVRTIDIVNTGATRRDVTVFASDWQQNRDGSVEAVEPGTTPRSASTWVGVHPQRFVLEPGATQQVTVNIAIPAGAQLEHSGDYYTMVFSQIDDEAVTTNQQTGREMRIKTIGRIGTKILIRPPNHKVEARVAVSGMTLEEDRQLKIEVTNEGDSWFKSDNSVISLIDHSGNRVLHEKLAAFSCLPETKRLISFEVPESVPAGDYVMLAVIDYGGPELAAGELETTLPKGNGR